jgi:quercetin dioxygenase-like cupin family protein
MERNELVGSAFAAADLVEYQVGAVVSRVVLKQRTGSVTVFAFDRGEELSEHTVPHDALIQVIDGEAQISIAEVPHRVGTGEMLILPGGQPHAVKAATRFKMVLVMIKP